MKWAIVRADFPDYYWAWYLGVNGWWDIKGPDQDCAYDCIHKFKTKKEAVETYKKHVPAKYLRFKFTIIPSSNIKRRLIELKLDV